MLGILLTLSICQSSSGMYMRCSILYNNSHLQFIQSMKVKDKCIQFSNMSGGYRFVTPLQWPGTHSRVISNIHFNRTNIERFESNKGLAQCLEALMKELLQVAFNKLKLFVKLSKDRNCEEFLPGHLTRSKAQGQSEFQRKYRRKRGETYLRMRWKQNNSFPQVAYRLTSILQELVTKKKLLAFKKIKEPQLAVEPIDALEQTSDGGKATKKTFAKPFANLFKTPRKNSRTM